VAEEAGGSASAMRGRAGGRQWLRRSVDGVPSAARYGLLAS